MVTPRRLVVALLALLIGIFAAARLFPSDESKVKKQFRLLSKWVSRYPSEDPITAVSKAQRLRSLLADNVALKTHIDSLSGDFTSGDLTGLVARLRLQFSRLSVKFYDLRIEFPEEGTATAVLTANVTGRMTDGGYVDEAHELECVLKKKENRWLFSACEVIEVLRK